jgi:hypothetical protein
MSCQDIVDSLFVMGDWRCSIFSLENALEAADSDPRLHIEMVDRVEVGKFGGPGEYEIGYNGSPLNTRISKGTH